MSGVVEAVGDVLGGIGDFVGGALDTVGNVIGGIMENPLKALPMAVAAYFTGGASLAEDAFIAADAASLAEAGLSATQIAETLQASYGIAAAEAANYAVAGTQVADMAWDAASMAEQGISQSQIASTLSNTYGVTPAQAAFYSLPVDAQTAYVNAGMSPATIGDQLIQTARATDMFNTMPQAARDIYTSMGYSPYEIGNLMMKPELAQSGISLSNVKDAATALNTVKSAANVLGVGTQPGALGSGLSTGGMLATGANTLAGILQGLAGKDAATQSAAAQINAAQIAADAAKFKPVGVTTRFGKSNFSYDSKGNLTSAGYALTPELGIQQDKLIGASGGLLDQYLLGQQAALPMGQGAARAMELGQGYLQKTPQEMAAQFMAEQQALLAPTREREFASLENRLRAQGRLGLATGATESGMAAANPELEAFYNAKRMQDLQLAAQATQGGQQYATFGTGLIGTGGDLLKGMYGAQSAAYQPYQTAIGGATMLEGLGQQAMDQGINIGAKGTSATAASGGLLAQGMNQAAQTMQPANAYSPWASLLAGAGNMFGQTAQPTTAAGGMLNYDPTKYRLAPI